MSCVYWEGCATRHAAEGRAFSPSHGLGALEPEPPDQTDSGEIELDQILSLASVAHG